MSTTPSSSPLSLVRGGGRLLGSWNVLDAAGVLPGAVRLRLERDTDGATLEVVVSPRGGQALVQTKVGGVSYKRFTGFAEKEAAEVTRSFAQLLDEGAVPLAVWFPHLAMEATPSAGDRARFAELVAAQLRLLPGRVEGASTDDLLPVERDRLYFDPPGLAEIGRA